MDSLFGWCLMAALTIGAGIWFIKYAISEYDRYLYNRQHGWQ